MGVVVVLFMASCVDVVMGVVFDGVMFVTMVSHWGMWCISIVSVMGILSVQEVLLIVMGGMIQLEHQASILSIDLLLGEERTVPLEAPIVALVPLCVIE